MKPLVYITCCIFFCASQSLPAAEITSAQVSARTITIQGSGFGSQSPMYFWDDVEDNFAAQGSIDNKVVSVGSDTYWGNQTDEYGTPMRFKSQTNLRNDRAGAVYYGEGHKTTLGDAQFSTVASPNTMYVSWWYKPSMHPGAEGGSNKFIRIWDNPNGLGTRLSWTHMHLTCDGESWFTWNGTVGAWNRHEIFVDFTKKVIEARINGNLVHRLQGCAKSSSYSSTPLFVEILGFDHGDVNYNSMTTMLDDIYIGRDLTRVEFSNASEWSYSDKNEVLPIESWSDNQIVVKIPISTLVRPNSQSYIYLFDKDNNYKKIMVNCDTCPVAHQ